MRRLLICTYLFLVGITAYALTIPEGTLYFDNSLTGYTDVRFVYGTYQKSETYALAMTNDGDKWRVDIPQTVTDMYRFTFVGAPIREGLYDQTFSTFKDSISHQANLLRTATSDAQMANGDIYVPQTGDNWAQGSWKSLTEWLAGKNAAPNISGTLPVVYIRTDNNAAITSTETYIKGSLYIDPLTTGYASLGSEIAPIAAQFKGRGNYTWKDFAKKPYKIKFDVKQSVLGMPNNRHWCLMAHADDYLGFLKDKVGHLLSEQIGMRWTPKIVPVELVINGQYKGLYFLTEHVRIAGNRIHITEQTNNATDSVTGGWLVEIDNYAEDGNITFREGNGQQVMVTIKEPDTLSTQQRNYIENQISSLNSAIYGASASTLWAMLDIDEAAKFYLVQEIMEDCESYHGSCYLYKDRDRNGQTAKWCFGPVWDFGNAYNRHQETWIYDNPTFDQYWIGQIAKWPEFIAKVKEYWYVYYHSHRNETNNKIAEYVSLISSAAANDAALWRGTQNYQDNSNISDRKDAFLDRYNWRIQWLYSQWGEGKRPATWGIENACLSSQPTEAKKYMRNGQLLIERNGQIYTIQGLRVQ